MSDRIAVFNDGRIEQVGTPAEVYERPATEFVAGFVGTSNLLQREAARAGARPGRASSASGPRRSASPTSPSSRRRRGRALAPGRCARSSTSARPPGSSSTSTSAAPWWPCSRTTQTSSMDVLGMRERRVRLVWRKEHEYRGRLSRRGHPSTHAVREAPAPAAHREKEDAGAQHSVCSQVGARLVAVGLLAGRLRRQRQRSSDSGRPHRRRRPAYAGPVGDGEGTAQRPRLARLRRGRLDRPGHRLGDPLREGDRLRGQRQDLRHLGRGRPARSRPASTTSCRASGDASLRLIYGDKVQPVNTDLVPNYADIFADLKDKPWNTVDGVQLRHPARPRRQPAACTAPTRSTRRPDSGPTCGRRTRPLQGQGHRVRRRDLHRRRRGLPDGDPARPRASRTRTRSTRTQFDAAIALLEQQKPLVGEYWADYTKQASAFASGTTVQQPRWQVDGQPGQGRGGGPVDDGEAQGGRDRLVGHLDGRARAPRTSTARTSGWTRSSRPR